VYGLCVFFCSKLARNLTILERKLYGAPGVSDNLASRNVHRLFCGNGQGLRSLAGVVIVSQERCQITEEDLVKIEQRLAMTTPGPWRHELGFIESQTDPVQLLGVTMQRAESGLADLPGLHNGEFIAAARTDVPLLVAEIRRLRALLNHRV